MLADCLLAGNERRPRTLEPVYAELTGESMGQLGCYFFHGSIPPGLLAASDWYFKVTESRGWVVIWINAYPTHVRFTEDARLDAPPIPSLDEVTVVPDPASPANLCSQLTSSLEKLVLEPDNELPGAGILNQLPNLCRVEIHAKNDILQFNPLDPRIQVTYH